MSDRIQIEAWGIRPEWARNLIGGAAVVRDGETWIEAVVRSIERRTGLSAVTCRADGTALDGRGSPESQHYEITLGRASRGGGYSVEGGCWVAVPVRRPRVSAAYAEASQRADREAEADQVRRNREIDADLAEAEGQGRR